MRWLCLDAIRCKCISFAWRIGKIKFHWNSLKGNNIFALLPKIHTQRSKTKADSYRILNKWKQRDHNQRYTKMIKRWHICCSWGNIYFCLLKSKDEDQANIKRESRWWSKEKNACRKESVVKWKADVNSVNNVCVGRKERVYLFIIQIFSLLSGRLPRNCIQVDNSFCARRTSWINIVMLNARLSNRWDTSSAFTASRRPP